MKNKNTTPKINFNSQILTACEALVSEDLNNIKKFECIKSFDSKLTSVEFKNNIDILLKVAADMITSQRNKL
mgnify:CR=1 FL=1|tara:strand:+ start:61 stop:276 length:216 start_codon:yes stop_codon:yes gene_type:complete